jgi:hypothetical protein
MAPSSRGLALIFTPWVVAWPAASIRTGSAGSGWWGTQEALALRQAAQARILTDVSKVRLTKMEAPIGLRFFLINAESFLSQNSLTHFHTGLRDFEETLDGEMSRRSASEQGAMRNECF